MCLRLSYYSPPPLTNIPPHHARSTVVLIASFTVPLSNIFGVMQQYYYSMIVSTIVPPPTVRGLPLKRPLLIGCLCEPTSDKIRQIPRHSLKLENCPATSPIPKYGISRYVVLFSRRPGCNSPNIRTGLTLQKYMSRLVLGVSAVSLLPLCRCCVSCYYVFCYCFCCRAVQEFVLLVCVFG